MNLIIDTNVFISSLIKDSLTRYLLVNSLFNLFIPEQELIEIKRYEELVSKKSGQSLSEIRDLTRKLLKYVTILRNDILLKYRGYAHKIIGKIDKSDVPFIAAALALNCPIWLDECILKNKKQLKSLQPKIFLNITKRKNENKKTWKSY